VEIQSLFREVEVEVGVLKLMRWLIECGSCVWIMTYTQPVNI